MITIAIRLGQVNISIQAKVSEIFYIIAILSQTIEDDCTTPTFVEQRKNWHRNFLHYTSDSVIDKDCT